MLEGDEAAFAAAALHGLLASEESRERLMLHDVDVVEPLRHTIHAATDPANAQVKLQLVPCTSVACNP